VAGINSPLGPRAGNRVVSLARRGPLGYLSEMASLNLFEEFTALTRALDALDRGVS
jgi:hypothetical protein